MSKKVHVRLNKYPNRTWYVKRCAYLLEYAPFKARYVKRCAFFLNMHPKSAQFVKRCAYLLKQGRTRLQNPIYPQGGFPPRSYM